MGVRWLRSFSFEPQLTLLVEKSTETLTPNSTNENKISRRNEDLKHFPLIDDADSQTEKMVRSNSENMQSLGSLTNVAHLPLLESFMKTHKS
jgi:hypothetical protein